MLKMSGKCQEFQELGSLILSGHPAVMLLTYFIVADTDAQPILGATAFE